MSEDLERRYEPITVPAVDLGLDTATWLQYEGDLHLALESFRACQRCTGGRCQAMPISASIPAYYALHLERSKRAGRPVFVVRECTNWRRRRDWCRAIAQQLVEMDRKRRQQRLPA